MPRSRQDNLVAGLDIGSAFVRMAVGQVFTREETHEAEQLHILGLAEVSSQGVHRGIINSIEDVVSAVSECLEQTERMVGVPLDSVWVGVSGLHIMVQKSHGVVAVSKPEGEIGEEDVARAVEASRSIATPLNYEVLHVLPKSFSIDGQSGIKDPVGMTGIRLEVDTQIILGSAAQIKNLTKAIYRAGLEIDDLVLSIIAAAEAVITPRQKELGVVVVNLGASTTSLVAYEEGEILHTAIIPLGSEHITNDIAIGLRTSIDIAEAVKIAHGNCAPDAVFKRDQLDLYEVGAPEHELIKKEYLHDIIQARAEEILRKINAELTALQRSGLLPAGVVFTGAGAKLGGLIDLSKKILRLPSTLGYPLGLGSVTDKINDLGFSSAVGLVKWGSMMGETIGRKNGVRRSGLSSVRKVGGALSQQLKKMMKSLIP